jgi:hypothetical protein
MDQAADQGPAYGAVVTNRGSACKDALRMRGEDTPAAGGVKAGRLATARSPELEQVQIFCVTFKTFTVSLCSDGQQT